MKLLIYIIIIIAIKFVVEINDKGISEDEFEYFDLSLTPKYIQKSKLH